MRTAGLSLDQAPQLSIPVSFFLTVPLAVFAAGCILLISGNVSFSSPWMPHALALTHIGTLGVLAMGMIGALYQMTPVIAGSAVPFTRIAHIVHALLLVGLAGFIWRLIGGPESAMTTAISCFALALLAFLVPLGWALLRTSTQGETVQGMRLAVVSLAVITVMGLLMAKGYAGQLFPEQRMLWMQIHLTLALLGWVGGLIMAVSWQVIPMFYLASNTRKKTMRWWLGLLLLGLILSFTTLFTVKGGIGMLSPAQLAGCAALPAALVIWVLHPFQLLLDISKRKRKRADASLLFWKTGLGTSLILLPLAVAALSLPDPRWQILFGWLAIWGWAGMIMHGMLSRIVPFLIWFHRYSTKVGFEPTPSMRSLLPQKRIRIGFILHLSSVLVGMFAIFVQVDWLARLTGLILIATAGSLMSMLIHVIVPRSR